MKKVLLFLFSLLLGVGLFIWILKFVGWQEIKNALLVFTGWHGIVILVLTILMALVGNWKWKEILRGEEVKISFGELLKSYLAGYVLILLAPIIVWGGEIFRGYFLKKKNSIPWSKGMASVVIDRVFEWTANSVVIIFGLLFFIYKICFPPKNIAISFGIFFLIFISGVSYFYLKVFKKESFIKIIASWFGFKEIKEKNTFLEIENEIFKFFKVKNKTMWSALTLSFLRAAIMWLRAWLLIFFLGKSLSGLLTISILGFTYLAAMIPIPTSLGFHEAIQIFAFNSLELNSSTATAFTMIIRGAELLVALAGVIILFKLGIELLRKIMFKKVEQLTNNNKNEPR